MKNYLLLLTMALALGAWGIGCGPEGAGEDSDTGAGDADADADGDADADADGDTDTDADGDGDTDADGDADTDADGDADTDTDTDTDADADGDADTDTDADADGDADTDTDTDVDADADGLCLVMEDCETGYCEIFQNTPIDQGAFCTDAPPGGQMHVLGNLRDFETGEYMPDVAVKIAGAAQASINPNAAYNGPLLSVTTDANGRFESRGFKPNALTTAALGLVALVKKDDYFFSSAGLVEPQGTNYPAGLLNHDVWLISNATRDKWVALMQADDTLSNFNPRCMGMVVYVETGEGVEGVTVEPTNAQTNSQVHYLNENEDGFNQDATGSKGLFLIVNPGLVEGFEAFRGDTRINAYTAKVGAASGAVFSVTMPVYLDDDPKP